MNSSILLLSTFLISYSTFDPAYFDLEFTKFFKNYEIIFARLNVEM